MADQGENMLFMNMREMISLIDKLRDFNLDRYISLPRIAVLGEQSAGKSSLLESVAGLNFLPRGTGIVTRRPLELRMICTKESVPYFTFPRDFGDKKFTKSEEVVSTIELLTDKETNGTKSISDSPIVCNVYSPTVPDLTLIDLPGITRIAVQGQPDNIEEISKNLVAKYCSDPNTLILCVVPANIDIATSEALAFVRKLDPDGSRTLGVLTKIDIMDEGDNCQDALMNKTIPLKYGYIGVKGRSQMEMKSKVSVEQAIKKEMEFFAKHPVYSMLPTEMLGTRSLIDKMSSILFKMIQGFLPQLKSEISSRVRSTKQQFEALGEEFPEEEEKKLELVFKLVRKFKDCFDQAINGRFLFDKTSQKKDKKSQDQETITFQLNSQFSDLFKKYSMPDYRASADLKDEQIERALEVYQAAAMPGFYSIDSFLALINPKLETLKDPVFHVLDECRNILESRGLEQLDSVFKKFNKLHAEMKETFLRFLAQERNITRKILENLVRSEENYLFTNDVAMLNIAHAEGKSTSNVQVLEMRARIDAYFSIVVRNLRDFVPKIIGQFLVKHFNQNLEVELLNGLSKRNYCLESFNESDAITSQRGKLKHELDALSKADSLLVNSFNIGYSVNKHTLKESISTSTSKTTRTETPIMTHVEELNDIEALHDEFIRFNEALASRNNVNYSQASTMQTQDTSHSNTKLQEKDHVKITRITAPTPEKASPPSQTPAPAPAPTPAPVPQSKSFLSGIFGGDSQSKTAPAPAPAPAQPVQQPKTSPTPAPPAQAQRVESHVQKKDPFNFDFDAMSNPKKPQSSVTQVNPAVFQDPRIAGAAQAGASSAFGNVFGNAPGQSQQANPSRVVPQPSKKTNLFND